MNERRPVPYWISIPAVLVLVLGFRLLFGEENTVIGMLFFVSCVYIARSASVQIRPFVDGPLVFILLSGFALIAEFASFDALLLLGINLVVLFVLAYSLFSSFDNIVYFPIVMAYIYIMTAPEGVENLPMRIGAILAGTIVMIAFYALFQASRKLSKPEERIISLLDHFSTRLRQRSHYGEDELVTANIADIREMISATLAAIYRDQRRSRQTSGLEKAYISLTLTIERYLDIFARLAAQGAPSPAERLVASELAGLIEETKRYLSSASSIRTLATKFDEFAHSVQGDTEHFSPELFEVLETSTIAAHSLKSYVKAQNPKKMPRLSHEGSEWARDFINSMKPSRLRFSFAFKYSIAVSLTLFVITAYQIEHGLWMLIVIALMLRPYHEDTSARSRSRLMGNIIGVSLFLAAFYFIPSSTAQLALIAIAYIIFSREVGPTTRSIAASAYGGLGLAAHASHMAGTTLGFDRVIYVFIGMGVAYLVSRFVLPYNMSRATQLQVNAHRRFSHQLLAIFLYSRTHKNPPQSLLESAEASREDEYIPATLVFETLVLYAHILEQQIDFNNRFLHEDELSRYLSEQHQLVNDIHYLYGVLSLATAKRPAIAHLLHELSDIIADASELNSDEFIANEDLLARLEALLDALDAVFGFSLDARVKIAVTTLRRVIVALTRQIKLDFSEGFTRTA